MIEPMPLPTLPWQRRSAAAAAQNRSASWLVWGVLLLCLLTLLCLYQSSQTEAARQRIRKLQQREIELEQRNAQLVREIASWEDLRWVSRRAGELGFAAPAPEETLYLALEPSPQTAAAPLADQTTSALSGIRRWLPRLRAIVGSPPSLAEARALP